MAAPREDRLRPIDRGTVARLTGRSAWIS